MSATQDRVPGRLLVRLSWQGLVRSGPRAMLTVLIGTVGALILLVGVVVYPVAQAQTDRVTRQLELKQALGYAPGRAGLLLEHRRDHYRDSTVGQTSIASVGGSRLRPVGVPVLPAAGELVVSPAMAHALRVDPVLRQRYPGRVVAVVAPAGLVGPRDLRLYRGASAAEMIRRHTPLTLGFEDPRGVNDGLVPSEVRAGVPFTIIAFLVPLLGLFSVVATMGSAARSRRVAALRLVGLTSRQVRAMFAGEAVLTTTAAFLIAFVLLLVLKSPLAPLVPVEDGVWPQDVTVPVVPVLAAAVVLPVLAGMSVWWSLRRSAEHLMEYAREAAGHSVSLRRFIPLVAGVVSIVAAEVARRLVGRDSTTVPVSLLAAGCVLTITGLVLGTSVVNLFSAGALGRVTGRVDSLIASRRVMANPVETAKVGAGVSMLVFVGGLLLSFFPLLSESTADQAQALTALVGPGTFISAVSSPGEVARLRASPGVGVVAEIHQGTTGSGGAVSYVGCSGAGPILHLSVTDCLRGLPTSAVTVLRNSAIVGYGRVVTVAAVPAAVWRLRWRRHQVLVAPAAGADPERVRTALIAVTGTPHVNTAAEDQADKQLDTKTFRDITLAALVLAALVAAASLTASLVEQLQLQRRSYAMLKITGVSTRTLTSSLLRQTMLTVTPTAVTAWGLGMVATVIFLGLNDTSVLATPVAQSLWMLLAALLAPALVCLGVLTALRAVLGGRLD